MKLEPIRPAHAARVQILASDPAIGLTSNVPSPYPANGAKTWIRRARREWAHGTGYTFAVLDEQGELVGVASLLSVDPDPATAVLGYWIGRPYWGRGHATAAGLKLIEFGFGKLKLRRIESSCLEHNLASLRVLQKLGFTFLRTGSPNPRGVIGEYRLDREAWGAEKPDGPAMGAP